VTFAHNKKVSYRVQKVDYWMPLCTIGPFVTYFQTRPYD